MNRIDHPSPVGVLALVSDGHALTGVYFQNHAPGGPPARVDGKCDAVLDAARKQLDQYFAGRRKAFDVAVAPRGTPFQTRVWAALQKIGYGETSTYGAIALDVGAPAAVRAAGGAIGRNPVSIIIPCHRVIGANGKLTGFGGGLARKQHLLAIENGGLLIGA
jgi:methylated-DNA-[protein]-cysteine S-methyltransferase